MIIPTRALWEATVPQITEIAMKILIIIFFWGGGGCVHMKPREMNIFFNQMDGKLQGFIQPSLQNYHHKDKDNLLPIQPSNAATRWRDEGQVWEEMPAF